MRLESEMDNQNEVNYFCILLNLILKFLQIIEMSQGSFIQKNKRFFAVGGKSFSLTLSKSF